MHTIFTVANANIVTNNPIDCLFRNVVSRCCSPYFFRFLALRINSAVGESCKTRGQSALPLLGNVKLPFDAWLELGSALGNQCRLEGRIMATELRLLFRCVYPTNSCRSSSPSTGASIALAAVTVSVTVMSLSRSLSCRCLCHCLVTVSVLSLSRPACARLSSCDLSAPVCLVAP